MVADYDAGMTPKEIGERYGHGRDAVMKHLAQPEFALEWPNPLKLTLSTGANCIQKVLDSEFIARQVGWNLRTISKYLEQREEPNFA